MGKDGWILQQDNAPIHNNVAVHRCLNEENVKLLGWPPKSPQFNIIERCWSILQYRVNQLIFHFGQPKHEHYLYRYALVAWRSIDQKIIDNLYNHIPKEIKLFTERKF